MKTIVHVNQFKIRENDKLDVKSPVLSVKSYKSTHRGNIAIVRDRQGKEIGRFIYRPWKPLACGARVWFETNYHVEVVDG